MSEHPELSIGALSAAVDIPVATLRTWERRYGYPEPVRRPSGHRRYPIEVVAKLQLVKRLTEHGHKPSEILPLATSALRALLGIVSSDPAPVVRHRSGDDRFDEWFHAVDRADSDALTRILHESWARHGAVPFMDDVLAPFLVEVGLRWTTDRLTIGAEHFASHVIADFLSTRWRPLSPRQGAPVAVCAVFSSERHILGLHMAAAALALDGWDVRFLGADTPASAIASMSRSLAASAIAIGTASSADPQRLAEQVRELRQGVGEDVAIWLGGAPVPESAATLVEGITKLAHLVERARRLRDQVAGARQSQQP